MLSSMMLATIDGLSFESVYKDDQDAPRFLAELNKLGVKPSLSPKWLVRKTHNAADVTSGDTVIWIIRDGRDAMTSYWKYYEKVNKCNIDPIEFWKTRTGPASDGVTTMWHEQAKYVRDHVSRCFPVRYEDLIHFPERTMFRIANILGCPAELQRLSLVSFDRLHGVNPGFYRKGRVGTHAELPANALHWLTEKMKKELTRLDYLDPSHTGMGAGI